MGKLHPMAAYQQRQGCSDESAPICGSKCCNTPTTEFVKFDNSISPPTQNNDDNSILSPPTQNNDDDDNIHELLIVGAGPHAHALMLRLLSHEPDFLSEKERHKMAEYKERMRPPRDVNNYLRRLCRGPKATLKPPRKKRSKGSPVLPPPLTLEEINTSVLVVDSYGSWMEGWKNNFNALRIPKLRSLMSAHNDPYDHRALECKFFLVSTQITAINTYHTLLSDYAEMRKRGDELITLPNLKQKDPNFKGPYQVPSTAIFNDFHDLLSSAYGIENAVTKGTVLSITPRQLDGDDEAIFEVVIQTPTNERRVVKTKRVVCALGPMFRPVEMPWMSDLPPIATRRILHSHQICPFINHLEEQKKSCNIGKILIVGGGITSAQLALLASKAEWCTGVIFIQRSNMKPRHFDIKNEWMGPKRGKMLEEFWSSDIDERANQLKEARGGGTIPPEIIEELIASQGSKLEVKTEVEIDEVEWEDNNLKVSLTDGSKCMPAMIWLSTGAQNHIDHYTVLSKLHEVLPVNVVDGLPVIDNDLSWKSPEDGSDEPRWKQTVRKRLYCCGALSGLQCGPDSLNLIGARHGAVKVAQSIRHDFEVERLRKIDATDDESFCESCC